MSSPSFSSVPFLNWYKNKNGASYLHYKALDPKPAETSRPSPYLHAFLRS